MGWDTLTMSAVLKSTAITKSWHNPALLSTASRSQTHHAFQNNASAQTWRIATEPLDVNRSPSPTLMRNQPTHLNLKHQRMQVTVRRVLDIAMASSAAGFRVKSSGTRLLTKSGSNRQVHV